MKKTLIPAIIGIAVLMAVASCGSQPAPAVSEPTDTAEVVLDEGDGAPAESELVAE
ncbi:hypothetical protein FACS189473_5270 [Spirochaetia bacterium]|nr:hypothetical protein FACS189473_5270 [Spirochaetia bacterium]